MAKPLCIYHKNCLDGKAAAAVVLRVAPDAELLPMQYGEPAPTALGRDAVYVVDFSFPIEGMRALRAQAGKLVWLDHHATAVETQRRLGFGIIDQEECGATLAWRELFPGRAPPPILAYIRDKDLWRWQLPDSRAVAAGLAQTFAGTKLDGLLETDPAAMAELGKPLIAAQRKRVDTALGSSRAVEGIFGVPGLRALTVQAGHDQNEIADTACRAAADGGMGYDLAVVYYRRGDGTWVHSLRSLRVDCAAIAEHFGGGGHPSSACFMSPKLEVPQPPAEGGP